MATSLGNAGSLSNILISTAHPSLQPKRHLYRFSRFCTTDDRRVSLYFSMGRPFPPNNCRFPWGIWTPSNTWFLRPTRVLNQTAPRSVQPFLQGWLVRQTQTDRPTDHASRSVTINRIYLRTPRLKKTSHRWLAINFRHMNGFWYFWQKCYR